MQNIEIKARYPNLEKARAIASKLGARAVSTETQIDTYFKTASGRLKLRESSIKPAELIPYDRPSVAGPKKSEYLVVKVEEPAKLKVLMSSILGVDVVVEKKRELFLLENVRIHLDEVKGLGCFFEFEAVYHDLNHEKQEQDKVQQLIANFEIASSDLLTGSYRELVKSKI